MNPTPSRSYDLLWLSLALLILLPIAYFLSITPHDYWFHVRMGKDIVETGAIPRVDTFSYTYLGRPIFYQPWLSAVLFWWGHSTGGATLTFLLRGICIGLAYSLIWALMRHIGAGTKLATLLTILLGLSSSMNWSMRPQMFVYPLFALMLWVLWHWQNGRPKLLWTLPVATLLWVNLHDSFILAFILMGSALLFGTGNRKQLTTWLILSLFATLINPRGVYVWEFVSQILSSPSSQSFAAEWQPPVNEGWQMHIFFGWLLLFIPLAVLSPRRVSLLEGIWFLAFGWLALSDLRNVIWFLFIMAVLSGALLAEFWKSFRGEPALENTNPTLNYVLSVLILAMPLMMLPGLRDSWWKDSPAPYHEATTPIAATEWLAAHPNLPGPLFTEYTFGSYLTFALPSRLLWIDSRFNAYPAEHWRKYQTITSAQYPWEKLLDVDKVNLLMLSLHTQNTLAAAVAASGVWCEQYRDQTAVIFLRCEPMP